MPDYTFKIITAGEGSVGKTTMLRRYVDGKFNFNTQMTIGVEIFQKTIKLIDINKTIVLQLWDFGGQERFRFFLDSFVLGASAAFIVFDLTRMHSFEKVDEWVGIVRKYDPKLPLVLLGSKADLTDQILIKDETVLEKKKQFNFIDYLKTSAKTNLNIDKAFEVLLRAIFKIKNL